MNDTLLTPYKMNKLKELLNDGVCIDGGHHKQWALEQIALVLSIELDEHEEGIAP